MATSEMQRSGSVPRPRAGLLSGLVKAIQKAFSSPVPPYVEPKNVQTDHRTGPLKDLESMYFTDIKTLVGLLRAELGGLVNDRDFLIERLIQLLSRLPPQSADGASLNSSLIQGLWTSLHHPPVLSAGPGFRFREPDGSANNIYLPSLGAAGSPYARTVPAVILQPVNQPDAGLVFDRLMARGGTFHPHPNNISSVLFSFATAVIHDLFQTDSQNPSWNLTSSYLDLAPLYGRNSTEQAAVRLKEHGFLKPDCFSSDRALRFPPAVGLVLIMFNRYHNYVVTQLARINERGRFDKPDSDPSTESGKVEWNRYDNELFQTGRLITCTLYANIILHDYIRVILNLNRIDSNWSLDPRIDNGKPVVALAVGNQVSVEFNLIYRWHSAISQRDEVWTTKLLTEALGGKDPRTATPRDIGLALAKLGTGLSDDPVKRPFAGLQRGPDGSFSSDTLASLLAAASEDVASSFGAQRVPDALRPVEIAGILQARAWKVATLNELRHTLGLTRYTTFEQINPDKEVVSALAALYDSPDAVEMYPGLVAEQAKPAMVVGSGLCLPYTLSRAILSDAVALVRGDRFLTLDCTPANLTNWGFNEASSDPNVDNGNVLYKLAFRAFPEQFAWNSIYAHHPLVLPSENKAIKDGIGKSKLYSWDKPAHQVSVQASVKSYLAVKSILDNEVDFKIRRGEPISFLTTQQVAHTHGQVSHPMGKSNGDTNGHNGSTDNQWTGSGKWDREFGDFFAKTVAELLQQNQHTITALSTPGAEYQCEVDVIRDVINLASARFYACVFGLPIKSAQKSGARFTDRDIYQSMAGLFSILEEVDPVASSQLRYSAQPVLEQFGQLVHEAKTVWGVVHIAAGAGLATFGLHLLHDLLKVGDAAGQTVDEVVCGTVIPIIAAGIRTQSQVVSQALDYYLGDGAEHLDEMCRLAHLKTTEADAKLTRYMLEGCRLAATTAVFRDVTSAQTLKDGQRTVSLTPGSRLLLNVHAANRDAASIPDADSIRLDRPAEVYLPCGWGLPRCAGQETAWAALTALFKPLVALPRLRRTPGARGRLGGLDVPVWTGHVPGAAAAAEARDVWDGFKVYLTPDGASYWPAPTSMRVQWTPYLVPHV